MSYTCPKCNMTSHNPNDEKERYCGNCHQYKGQWPQHAEMVIYEYYRYPWWRRMFNEPWFWRFFILWLIVVAIVLRITGWVTPGGEVSFWIVLTWATFLHLRLWWRRR